MLSDLRYELIETLTIHGVDRYIDISTQIPLRKIPLGLDADDWRTRKRYHLIDTLILYSLWSSGIDETEDDIRLSE